MDSAGSPGARPATPRAAQGIVLGFLAYASWGLLSPVGKHLLGPFEPMGLNATRFVLATLLLLPFLGRAAVRDAVRLLARRDVLWANLLANVSLSLFLYSLVMLPATYATLGFYTAPLWTAALAVPLLRERAGPWFLPAAAGLLAGGYLALFGLAAPPAGFSALGMALAVGSGLVWAGYAVVLRKAAPDLPLKPLLGASFLYGSVYFALLALVLEGPPALLGQDAATWGWMALYVAVPTLASFVLFNAALQRAPAGTINLLVGAELGFTVLFAWLLLDDAFTLMQLAGLGLVLGCVTGYLAVQGRAQALSP
ncbi:MAG TPA: DMT family transporter [Candidatus Thermoplasmatota archaeon]|nr:DMT family transporter [Candidatus Thermoplasmatota archaeon]